MGNRQASQQQQQQQQQLSPQYQQPSSGAPKSFYLVVGGPKIRYIGDPPARGPLIFDVEVERAENGETVDHAETVQMHVAVPSKQEFKLTQVNSANKKFGFILSFALTMVEPGQTLRVLAGVDIEYHVGEGIRLMQAERSQNPFCVYEVVSPSEFCEKVEVSEALHLQKLKKASFSTDSSGMKRLVYAPIAIELTYEVPIPSTSSSPPNTTEEEGNNNNNNNNSVGKLGGHSREEEEVGQSQGVLSTASSSSLLRVVQYTFLDFPDAALERATLTSLLQDEVDRNAERPVYEAKVVRQLLQTGVEVYELDDVFDLGGSDDISDCEDDMNPGESTLCVICLTNPKDTTLLPCRHMCLCYECASVLRFQQTNRCPICRANIDRLMTV